MTLGVAWEEFSCMSTGGFIYLFVVVYSTQKTNTISTMVLAPVLIHSKTELQSIETLMNSCNIRLSCAPN